MGMSALDKAIYKEQINFSLKQIESLKDDKTPEGTEQFYHHVEIVNGIKERLEIAIKSKESLNEIESVLSTL